VTAFDHADSIPPTLRFERRQVDRVPTDGHATALRVGGDCFGQIHDLRLVDYSVGGLAAICGDPIEPGTALSLGFANPGWLARRGVVRRCLPCGSGYRVAIQFELGLAA
jgi:hypothetical protein